MRQILMLLCAGLLSAGAVQSATAQSNSGQTTADAKADGKAFGNAVIDQVKNAATTAPDASRVPGFNPAGTQSLEDLAAHPDRIEQFDGIDSNVVDRDFFQHSVWIAVPG